MPKAYQCSRCDGYFNPLKTEGFFVHFDNPHLRTTEDYTRGVTSGSYLVPRNGKDGNDVIDLCPKCTKELIKFMMQLRSDE